MLEFDKVVGYYPTEVVVALLKDGRYAMVDIHRIRQTDKVQIPARISISNWKLSFLRGHEIVDNIPQDLISETEEILKRKNLEIRDVG